MAIMRVVKDKYQTTNRMSGVTFACSEKDESNIYLVTGVYRGNKIKYIISPLFSKSYKPHTEVYMTKEELLEKYVVITITKAEEVKEFLRDKIGA